MPLLFYYASGSPYGWRVWLALEHKGLEYELRTLSFSAGDLKKPEYLAINPRGRVPALVHEGMALWESAAIVEYLHQAFPDRRPPLFPNSTMAAAQVRRMVNEADQYFAPAMEKLVDQLLYPAAPGRDQAVIAEGQAGVLDELARWEHLLQAGGGPFLAGPPSAADFALYPMLALVERMAARFPEAALAIHVGPAVAAWKSQVEALPYFAKTRPPHWIAHPS